MSEELSGLESELDGLFSEIRAHMDVAKKMKIQTDWNEKIEFVKDRLKRAGKAVSGYKVELRYIKQMNNPVFKDKVAKYEGTLSELQAELEWAEKERAGGAAPQTNPDAMSADDLLKKGASIQQQDIEILKGSLQTVEQDKSIGVEVLAHMSDQHDKLNSATEHLEHMESSMKLASREMRVLAKRMMTDKLIMGMIVLIVLGLIAVIVMAIVKPNSNQYITPFIPGTNTSRRTPHL